MGLRAKLAAALGGSAGASRCYQPPSVGSAAGVPVHRVLQRVWVWTAKRGREAGTDKHVKEERTTATCTAAAAAERTPPAFKFTL